MRIIPKVIHYCWFGKNPLPPLAEKCIASWKKYCTDYQIIEWNEENFDIDCCDFIREAYAEKKWAFVSDAARLMIIYEHGGVYLDTDVELIASLDSFINDNEFYFGIETKSYLRKNKKSSLVNTGLGFGSVPGNPIVKSLLAEYENSHFRNESEFDMIACPVKNSSALEKYGFTGEDRIYEFSGGRIYSSEYFCPEEHLTGVTHYSEHTVSIHHFSESWVTPRVRYWMQLNDRFRSYLPDGLSHYLASYISYIVYEGFWTGHKKLIQKLFVKTKNKLLDKRH